MRIVGGKLKGRPINRPKNDSTRPTSDRVRESIFNILDHASWANDLEGVSVVDVFAGTGAMGFEAMSRGAACATFIEKNRGNLGAIKSQAARFSLWRDVCLLDIDATHLAPPPRKANAPCQLAFVDPPYGEGLILPALSGLRDKGWVRSGSLIVVEMSKDETIDPPRGFTCNDSRSYGAAKIDFLSIT